jgi:hypothetical protein
MCHCLYDLIFISDGAGADGMEDSDLNELTARFIFSLTNYSGIKTVQSVLKELRPLHIMLK